MIATRSPTLDLIMSGHPHSDAPAMADTELDALKLENYRLRKKLAHLTAQYVWSEGGSFAKVNQEICQYGFRLERMDGAYDPRIVPIAPEQEEYSSRNERAMPEKVAGHIPENWRAGV